MYLRRTNCVSSNQLSIGLGVCVLKNLIISKLSQGVQFNNH